MKPSQSTKALQCAVAAARAAGKMMRDNFHSPKKVNSATQHDIKLELDVRCQKRIENILRRAFPETAILGEEGVVGNIRSTSRWVVDPIDGTVNFTYGIPHACVSIALQELRVQSGRGARPATHPDEAYETVVGVIYDPFCGELWTAIRGSPARLNGRVIHVSGRKKLQEAIISIGFAKQAVTMDKMLPVVTKLIHQVRKIRILGSAALSMAYVASGRLDAYLEYGLRLWDIAAGGLILECAGGDFWHRPLRGEHTYQILVNNGLLRKKLERFTNTLK